METKQIISGIAGLLFIVAYVPYIRAILLTRNLPVGHMDKAAPQKSSWLIWATLDTITFVGMYLKHSTNGQIIGAIAGSWIVVVLALKFGTPDWKRLDKFCLVGAVIGIVLWKALHDPVWAIVTSLCTVFLASFPTFKNAYHNPKSESRLAWTIYWLSCVVALFAVPKWTIEDAAQPATFTVIETIMMVILYLPRRKIVRNIASRQVQMN